MKRRRKTTSLPDSLRRQKHRADSDDRISDLPDPIIGQILSLLPTKNALATGLLSKRWKLLWTTIGNLDFFCRGPVLQFVRTVNYVLENHKPAGNFFRFSLIWETACIPFYVNKWICTSLARDVDELIVRIGIYTFPNHVQSPLFSNEKLKSLELKCRICIFPEFGVSLPRLESLNLSLVSFQSEEAFCKLLDGCPVLKHLAVRIDIDNMIRSRYIRKVHGVAAFKCRISSTLLKHLELYAYDASFLGLSCSALVGVEIDAPSLEYIYLRQINSIIVHQRLKFLCEAIIQLAYLKQGTGDPNYCNSFVEALCALSCARTLCFLDQTMQVLRHATIKMQNGFDRLTKLKVFIGPNCWSSVQNFIELSDSLEVLVINKEADYDDDEDLFNHSNWTKPIVVPRCLSNSLRNVSFGAYDGHPDQLAMIEYILTHGGVLNSMQIRFGEKFSSLNRKDELVQLISTFPKKSNVCEVKIADFFVFF